MCIWLHTNHIYYHNHFPQSTFQSLPLPQHQLPSQENNICQDLSNASLNPIITNHNAHHATHSSIPNCYSTSESVINLHKRRSDENFNIEQNLQEIAVLNKRAKESTLEECASEKGWYIWKSKHALSKWNVAGIKQTMGYYSEGG